MTNVIQLGREDRKLDVYLASPFFNEAQIDRVSRVEKALRDTGVLNVFSPRESQYTEEFGTVEWRDKVFMNNAEHIMKADRVVAIYDEEDSGTIWEIGAAGAMGIPVIVFTETGQPVNIMITESCQAFVKSIEELKEYDFRECKQIPYEGEVF